MATNNAINTDLVIGVARGGTGNTTFTSHGVLLGNGTSAVSATAELADGQLLIGSTGNAPSLATLTAGTGISITNGAGTITITNSGAGFAWEAITANQSAVASEGYITNGAGTITVTLPLNGSSSVGDEFAITTGSQGWILAQNASDQVRLGSSTTTAGTGGSLASSASGDTIYVVKTGANAWQVTSVVGNVTVV